MEIFLFEPVEYARLFNCSWYSVEAVPLESRRHPYHGAALIALAVAYTLCYVPCAVVIGCHLEHSCYKLMFALACGDLAALVANSILGYFAIQGMMFCSAPSLMFLECNAAFMFWVYETMLAVVLALNRCVELLTPKLAAVWFDGWRTWFWVMLVAGYSLVGGFFSGSCSFNSELFSYFHNPHAGYYPEWYKDSEYHSRLQTFHNMLVLIAIITLYAVLLLGLEWKRKWHNSTNKVTPANNNNNASAPIEATIMGHSITAGGEGGGVWRKRIFLQVAVISLVNALTAGLFVSFQYIVVPPWMVYATTYGLLCVHGMPGVVYLTWNPTIRAECKAMLSEIYRKLGFR